MYVFGLAVIRNLISKAFIKRCYLAFATERHGPRGATWVNYIDGPGEFVTACLHDGRFVNVAVGWVSFGATVVSMT